MEETDESCCTIDYEHHKEIFEKRRQAYLKDPDKAVTTHQAKIRLIRDHYKEAKVSGGTSSAATIRRSTGRKAPARGWRQISHAGAGRNARTYSFSAPA